MESNGVELSRSKYPLPSRRPTIQQFRLTKRFVSHRIHTRTDVTNFPIVKFGTSVSGKFIRPKTFPSRLPGHRYSENHWPRRIPCGVTRGTESWGCATSVLSSVPTTPRPYHIRKTVRRLQQNRYIQTTRRNGHHLFALTTKGKDFLVQSSITIEIPHKILWDGTWRVVIFDIPETKGWCRRVFQAALRQAGFYPLQRSVFVIPYPCAKEIHTAICALHFIHEVILIETKSLGIADRRVRDFFGFSR